MKRDTVKSTVDTWQSYVPERPLYGTSQSSQPTQQTVFNRDATAAAAAAVSVETPQQQQRIHSLQDDVWKSTQKATSRLVKHSVKDPLPEPKGAAAAVDNSLPRVKVEHAPQDNVAEIQPMEDVPRRDPDLELFALEMERRPLRPSQQLVLELPPAIETLAYCSQFKKGSMPWYIGGQKTVATNPDLSFPIIPLYSRAYLQPFMREPDPRSTHERPCFNLDREPVEGEQGRVRCIAHRLSEERLGPGQAYRLRELLNTTQCTQISAALAHRGGTRAPDPAQYLPKIPEMCVMCHVWLTTEEALDQKNDHEKRKLKQVAVLNKFMVDIDKPGEYSRNCLLAGDDIAMGIWGPFPLWNERHYIPWKDPFGTGLRGFQELEDMLFRLSLDPSQPSTRTRATPAGSRFLH